jgi:hypothetical protein
MNAPLEKMPPEQGYPTNLRILAWFGLAMQAVGVVVLLSSLAARTFGWDFLALGGGGAALAAPLFIVFGIAVAGWAGNYAEILALKKRVSALENSTTT